MRALLPLLLLAAPAAAQSFQTPSGNIHCAFWGAEVRCDILERSTPTPPRPAGCDLDWGTAYGVGTTGAGTLLCVGDTVMDRAAPVLGYGQTFGVGALTCSSERTGLTCRNAEGHGFSLSRAAQRVF